MLILIDVQELAPGHAIITKKSGESLLNKFLEPLERKHVRLNVFIFLEVVMRNLSRT